MEVALVPVQYLRVDEHGDSPTLASMWFLFAFSLDALVREAGVGHGAQDQVVPIDVEGLVDQSKVCMLDGLLQDLVGQVQVSNGSRTD